MTSARERFTAMLFTLPLLQSDLGVVLCGQDAAPRIAAGAELMRSMGCPKILLSGGVDGPKGVIGADRAKGKMMGYGVNPGLIEIEVESQNTKEQAVNVINRLEDKPTQNLMLMASPYHAPRAFLTFLRELQARAMTHKVRLLCLPASQCKWSDKAEGSEETRLALYEDEFRKIEEYGPDVATYAEGVEYLSWWEQNG